MRDDDLLEMQTNWKKLTAERNRLKVRLKQAHFALVEVSQYIAHKAWCEVDICDVCTCGMATARAHAKEAVDAT